MNKTIVAQQAKTANFLPPAQGALQRKCVCGNHTVAGEECAECAKNKSGLQRKLAIGASNDPLEREADRVADQVLAAPTNAIVIGAPPSIQRYAGHATEDGMDTAPASVDLILASSGRSLEPALRLDMEQRFGHDFSQVRVHTGGAAEQSAREVSANAYTVGHNVVFGEGQFAPETYGGRWLLAHELTHVVQQSGADGIHVGKRNGDYDQTPVSSISSEPLASKLPLIAQSSQVANLQRRNILDEFVGLFSGDTFKEKDLQDYLIKLDTTGKIEDFTDSDNKARAIVNSWRLGGSPYVLTAQRKILLIKEMQSGFTGDDDEQAILEILERSYNFELGMIFIAVNLSDLNSDFHGEEWEGLQSFYGRRFEGGMEAMLKSQIHPKGLPVPLGVDLNKAGEIIDNELPGAKLSWEGNPACVIGILCSKDSAVVTQLPNVDVVVADKVFYDNPYYDGTAWITRRFEAGGFSNSHQKLIGVLSNITCDEAAYTFIHEVRHQNQPASWDVVQKETDAYVSTEQWSIERGLPGRPPLRTTDPKTGGVIPNQPVIEQKVREKYAGVSSVPGEKVINRTVSGDTVVLRPDGSTYTRPPLKGDTYQAPRQMINDRKILKSAWKCPKTKLP